MAQKVSIVISDDIDGSEDANTHTFAVDGVTWEIDLSEKNHDKLMKALDPYLSVARKAGKSTGRKSSATTSTGPDPKAVRAWGMENGFADQIPARGRIPQVVREAYLAAQ